MVHVVLVVPGGFDVSGRERVIPALLWLAEGLAEHHRVTVVALGQERDARRFALVGATVRTVPAEARGPYRLARQIARGISAVGAEGRPDVVHGLWASVTGLVAVAAARRYRAPGLVHVAGGELVAMPDIAYGGALGRGGRLIAAGGLKGADHVTVASHWMAAHVRSRGYRVDDVVPLGVDTERFRPAAVAAPGAPPRLVHIGSLNGVKDQVTLLKAFATVRRARPGITLDIAGVDTTDGATRRVAAQFGVADAVRFHGFVPSDELVALVQGATLHVLSSRHDAGPVAVLEAAACGVPTVGTDVGHVADLAVADPPGAVAVPVRHADELAAAILSVLADEPRRVALACAAHAFAVVNDRRATVARFDAAYRQLLARR